MLKGRGESERQTSNFTEKKDVGAARTERGRNGRGR